MNSFKVGDRVRCLKTFAGESWPVGLEGVVCDIDGSSIGVSFKNATCGHGCGRAANKYYGSSSGRYGDAESLELIEEVKIKTIMTNLKTTFKNLFRSEPEKSMIKAGILDEQENFTTEGSAIFIDWLFSQNKVKFNDEVVVKLLAEKDSK